MGKYLYEDLTYKLRGVFFKVYNTLGPGFREKIYHRAVVKELKEENIPFETEKRVNVKYDNEILGYDKLDLVVDNRVLLELKATNEMHSIFENQILAYLKASGLKLGLLVNFGKKKLEIKRYINEKGNPS
jgi:GxxExxY protein